MTRDDIALMMEIVEMRAPYLRPVAQRVARKETITRLQVEELTDVLVTALWDEDTSAGFSPRGKAIDALIGRVYQWTDDFFAS